MIYTALCVVMRGHPLTWVTGRGMGPENHEFFGPQMTLAYRLVAILQGLNNSRFPGPNPLPLAQVMDAARIKSITQGAE
jgi:hypothetical protein